MRNISSIERELSLIHAYEKNLVDAIAKGQHMDPLLEKLKTEEARRQELTKELESLEALPDVGSLDEARFKRELKARLADMRTARPACDFSSAPAQNPSRLAATS